MAGQAHPTLASGPLSLVLAPEIGGSIARLDYVLADGRTMPVFRGIAAGEGTALDQACFPLVPYVNRIRGGAFVFRGRAVRLAPNLTGEPSPLHGGGWLMPWQLEHCSGTEARLTLSHEAGEWPWRFHAAQHFSLDERGLDVVLSCTNAAEEPMPCGLGLHPYFPCSTDTVLDAAVESAWTIDGRTLPLERVPASGRYSLRHRRICAAGLDNGFAGWAGAARLSDRSWPFALTLSSPEARFLHIYAPGGGGFVAIEPVSHANAALNEPEARWPELGLRVLAPGGTMRLAMRLDVQPR